MQSSLWRTLAFVCIAVVLVVAGLYFYLLSASSLVSQEQGVLTTTPLPGGVDVSFLGVLAKEGDTVAGYVGMKNGSFYKLPPLPEGEEFVSLARGGSALIVLAKRKDTAVNPIYFYVNGAYVKQYEDEGLSALSVAPGTAFIGFSKETDGVSHVYALPDGAIVADDLGEGTTISFFTHDTTFGAWIIEAGSIRTSIWSSTLWKGGDTAYTSKKEIASFATNGASRFALQDLATGGAEERIVESLSPLTTTQLASFEKGEYAKLFFTDTNFYTLNLREDGSVITTTLQSPSTTTEYPLAQVISEVTDVFILNP